MALFLHQSTAKLDPVALERERLLSTLQEEASIAKDKVKQLSQVQSFAKNKSDIYNNLTKSSCDLQLFSLNGVKRKSHNSHKILI